LDFVLNSVSRKIFLIKSYDVVSECITFFSCSVCDVVYKKKTEVSNKTTALRKHNMQTVWKTYYWRIGYCVHEHLFS